MIVGAAGGDRFQATTAPHAVVPNRVDPRQMHQEQQHRVLMHLRHAHVA
jgi:hypothetical protein